MSIYQTERMPYGIEIRHMGARGDLNETINWSSLDYEARKRLRMQTYVAELGEQRAAKLDRTVEEYLRVGGDMESEMNLVFYFEGMAKLDRSEKALKRGWSNLPDDVYEQNRPAVMYNRAFYRELLARATAPDKPHFIDLV